MGAPVLRLVGPVLTASPHPEPRNGLRSTSAGMAPSVALHHELQAFGLAPKSVSTYANRIHSADAWCTARGSSLAKAPGPLVARYADTLPRGWASRKELRSACKWYWLIVKRKNPPLAVIRVPPKPVMVSRAHTEEEAGLLAKVARAHGDPHGLALALGLYQAMRREEIARCRWVDFKGGYVTIIGKGDKQRRIDLHPEVEDKLALLDRPETYAFPGRFDPHVAPATIWAWIRQLGEEAGVADITPHRLRHTCLATQNDENRDIRATMEFAGHSRMETTQGYTRTKAAAMRKAMLSVDYLGDRKRKPQPPRPQPWDQPGLFGDDED